MGYYDLVVYDDPILTKVSDTTYDPPVNIQTYPLTEEKCLEIGGHCWIESNVTFPGCPAQYTRYCKHCGKRQRGVNQKPIRWEDE